MARTDDVARAAAVVRGAGNGRQRDNLRSAQRSVLARLQKNARRKNLRYYALKRRRCAAAEDNAVPVSARGRVAHFKCQTTIVDR
jgi:hypothetical protein